MQTEGDFFTDQEIKGMYTTAISALSRGVRGLGYALVAYILASLNLYGLTNPFWLAVAIGILGCATASARFGQFAIAGLLAMATLPPQVVSSVAAYL